MSRNTIYVIAGVLAIAVLVLGYELYREQHKSGIEISVGQHSISVQKN
ncbi:MAG TPA: hypothetical protein VGT78_05980 [Rhizomicrobium sp.]|nr:hypothetical protein [Rhizomicrobium sp.]